MKRLAIYVLVFCLSLCSQASGQSGIITTVAGNGTEGFSGDGGPATLASLRRPSGVSVDAFGNLFIADTVNNRIRKVSASGIITTVAGNGTAGFSGDGGIAASAELNYPYGVTVDASGNLFIADSYDNRIRKVSASGIITTVAGNGPSCIAGATCGGFSGDGGPATSASLYLPLDVTVDASGNLFIADSYNNRIRKVSASGIITTVAGNGTAGFSGDGGLATLAALNAPQGIAMDASGNLFIADGGNSRIRKVLASGIIITVAGNGSQGFSGDGSAATSASLYLPVGVAVDAFGNLFVADYGNERIREVSANGVITTVAGNGACCPYSGDGGPATLASLNYPYNVALDISGNLFIADYGNSRIRKVSNQAPSTSSVTVSPANLGFSLMAGGSSSQQISLAGIAGVPWSASASASWITLNPTSGTTPSTITVGIDTASLQPGTYTATITISNALASPPEETMSVSLTVTAATATISVTPATLSFQMQQGGPAQSQSLQIGGTPGTAWQATAATSTGGAWLSVSPGAGQIPASLAALVSTGSLTAGTYQGRITIQAPGVTPSSSTISVTLTVTAASGRGGIITTVAGNGTPGYSGDGVPATSASLWTPSYVVVDSSGNLYIADSANSRVRKVSPSGIITTVAGNGTQGFSGDGGPATLASLRLAEFSGIAIDASGNIFIADSLNNRIRKVSANGIITTVAGNGTQGFSGDGGSATSASLSLGSFSGGLAIDASGNLFIADSLNNRIRKVSANGVITTVAGNGNYSSVGDGGPATSASLTQPLGVALDAAGNLFIADTNGGNVRKVSASGVITRVAGSGCYIECSSIGDGGPATSASLYPTAVALDSSGDLFIADAGNDRIRKVSASGIITTVAGNGSFSFSGDGGPATSASLNYAEGVSVDASGNLFIADTNNNRIREVLAQAPSASSLTVSPASLSFSLIPGASSSQQINLASPVEGLAWSASTSASWITLTPTSGTAPGTITVATNTASLQLGVYTASITISNPLASPPQETVTVSLTVTTATATISVAPTALNFQIQQGAPAQSQSLQIGGTAGTTWEATATTSMGGAWLSVSPGSGQIPASLTAVANPGSLTPGTYQGSITIQAPGATPSSSTISVTLTVPAAPAETVNITEYPVPTASSEPSAITAGSDGALWFTEINLNGGKIGRISTAGVITEYPVPTANGEPAGITAGPDGALWFVEEAGNKIGRVTTAGVITEYPVPTADGVPGGMTAGPDGALWFTEVNGNKIGRITTAGAITEYTVPTVQSRPLGITAGPDTALWFVEQGGNQIGRITTAGVITEYPIPPTAGNAPSFITAGPDGALWFTFNGNKIGRITTAGAITEYAVPTQGSLVEGIIAGPDGALWFYEYLGNQIGRITTAGMITEYAVPTHGSYPDGITAGPDGALWFTEEFGNQIGRAAIKVTPPSIASGGIVPVDSTVTTIQPGEWVSIYGTNLAGGIAMWNGDFPTSLGGTSVTINGKAAYLSLVSPEQINLQAPDDTAAGIVPVVVTTAGGSATSSVRLAQFSPSFFLLDTKHVAGLIVRSDRSGAYGGGTYDLIGPTGTPFGYPTVSAKAGDTIELFSTGLGPTSPAVPAGQAFSGAAPTTNPVNLLINNVSVTPTFAGLSGAGLYQINLTVPAGLVTGDVPLVATVGGVQTPPGVVISLGPGTSQCATIGGTWNVSESGSYTVTIAATAETDTFTDPVSGGGSDTITQTGCSIQYDPIAEGGLIGTNLTPSQLASLARTGTVSGNNVSVSGLVALVDTVSAAQSGLTITNISSNIMNASGQVSGNVMTLSETGKFLASGTYSTGGQSGSFTLTITTSSTATFDWASGVRPAFEGPKTPGGSASSVEIRVVADQAGGSSAGTVGIPALVRAALKKALVFADR